ncbi:MAG: hypothetical protein WBN92_11040 [Terriglobia bacterium]
MKKNWKLWGVAGLFVVAIVAVALAFSPRSQAQTASRAPAAYAYKVERIGRKAKDMDRILTDDGKDGWRVWRVEVVGPNQNDFVFVMEKPASTN